jgi:hypothetical protein
MARTTLNDPTQLCRPIYLKSGCYTDWRAVKVAAEEVQAL